MDRMLYVAMSGARETALAQAANANNLANVNTAGFRADLQQARAMPVFGPGYPSRVYALAERHRIDFTPGPMQATGNDLDVALRGEGFIAVQGADGKEAYSRRGDLQIDANGLLRNGAGQLILGDNGPIAIPPQAKIEIAADGTIGIKPEGAQADALASIDRIKLVRPPLSQLVKGEDGLLRTKDGKPQPADAAVTLVKGMVEGSNVDAVGALVEMIDLSRRFELQVKMMETAKKNDESAAGLLKAV